MKMPFVILQVMLLKITNEAFFLLGKYFVLKSTEISERSVSLEGVECVYHTISAIGTSLGRSLIAQNT